MADEVERCAEVVAHRFVPLAQHGTHIRPPAHLRLAQQPLIHSDCAYLSVFRGHCLDDRVSFNTQCSTQWDGFNHFPYKNYPKEGEYTYYGGQTTEVARDKSIKKYGIQSESCDTTGEERG